jgi:NADPH2:quinone reductase
MTRCAVVVDKSGAEPELLMADVPDPVPGPHQAVVDVRHAGVNYGDLKASSVFPAGTVAGFDFSGVVVQPAADGSGPAVGARVAGMAPGAWAQRMAASVGDLAEVPENVDLVQAAALPVAGVTALDTLRNCGPVLGKRVLITGATGGVGRFAVQLAALAGARVVAGVRSSASEEELHRLGAAEVVVGLDAIKGPFDAVLETVGGSYLVRAYTELAAGGSLQSIGWSSEEPAVFQPYSFYGPAKTLTPYTITAPAGPALSYLVGLVAEERLAVRVGWNGPWTDFRIALAALRNRGIAGKAVMNLRDA